MRIRLLTWWVAWLAWLPALLAQQPAREPHIGYIFPAGGRRGQTFEVTVGGQLLGGVADAFVSGSGVRITVVDIYKPLDGKRFAELQNIVAAARGKPAVTGTSAPPALKLASPAKVVATGTSAPLIIPINGRGGRDGQRASAPLIIPILPIPLILPIPPAMLAATVSPTLSPRKAQVLATDAEILKQAGIPDSDIKKFVERRTREADPKRQPNQQIAEMVTLKVEITPDAQPGPCEVRLITPRGMTNPLTFCIGDLPEQCADGLIGKTVNTAVRITLPVVLNGQILPGAVHHYSFQARRGEQLVIVTQARDLMPYLADTVPGWFQAAVALYDAKGNEVAYADHFRFKPDPVLHYAVPADGDYLLEIRDSLYRGREDFVYRVTVGEIPFVTDIFPLGGQSGLPAPVRVSGWNLSRTQVTLPPANAEGVHRVPSLANGLATGDISFASDALPQCLKIEPNHGPGQAQRVTLPIIINGRIDYPGDIDAYAFQCRAGEKIVAEVCARRLGSPLDSMLKVVDSKGRQLAFNDDCEDKGEGLLTHCADSRLTFTAAANGTYYVLLADAQGKGGPEYSYRLRISDPRPDYALRIVPSGISARPGAAVPVTVYALRKDGYAGDITLALTGNASGLVLNGGRVPAGQDQVRATLTFPGVPAGKPVSLALEGHATINGQDVVRPALPADDMIQAFMYHHLVPAREMVALVTGTTRGRAPLDLISPAPMILKAGGTGQAVLSLQGRAPFVLLDTQFQLSEPPEGISIGAVSPATNGTAISFKADAAKVQRGLKGNLIVEAFVERTPPAKDGKTPEKRRFSIGFLPAIPFEIAGP